jgi:hypothetical protein
MQFLVKGQATENSWPGRSQDRAYEISNDYLKEYKLTVDGVGYLTGVNTLNQSDLTFNTWVVVNNGTVRLQNNSAFVDNGTLNGTGAITANHSSVTIAGPSQTSETISLVNHSNLYLGVDPGIAFLAPIAMDATSTIHLTNQPATWGSILSSNSWNVGEPPALSGHLAMVKSITPGYQPEVIFQFGPGSSIAGVTIVDKPIIAAHHS